jgi:hypothetical protein
MAISEAGRSKIRIEASPQAAGNVDSLLNGSQPALSSETLSRCNRSGKVHYVVACENAPQLDTMLFSIEKVPGAAVRQCTPR